MKMEKMKTKKSSIPHKNGILLFLHTNVAAMMSHAKHEFHNTAPM